MTTCIRTDAHPLGECAEHIGIEALELLKDIVNSADNGQPFTPAELTAPDGSAMLILNRAYEAGIRLAGEDEA